jgi:CHRD domain.
VVGGGSEVRYTGCAIFAFDCYDRQLEFIVAHNVPNAERVSVHFGEEGVGGPVLFSVDSRNLQAVFGSRILTHEEQYYLYTRQLYITVSSNSSLVEVIRGQIGTTYTLYSYLSGTFVSSPVTTSALGCATFLFTNQTREFDYAIYHTVADPILVTLSKGSEGQEGFVDRIFPSLNSPIRGNNFLLDDDEVEALAFEDLYVQVVSSSYPVVGEIRGQIKQIRPCKPQDDYRLSLSDPDTFYSRYYSSGVTSGQLTIGYFQSSDSSPLPSPLSLLLLLSSLVVVSLHFLSF